MTTPPLCKDLAGVGIGLRQPHYAQVLQEAPPLGFVEVHSENFFADGGAALGVLVQARQRYAVSLHGVGLALGSAAGIDPWHLDRLARLVERIEPARVSDHACFARASRAPGQAVVHGNDLLPIAFTPAALRIMVAHVTQVQERLRRPMLVENLSAYLSFRAAEDDDTMGEPQFFAELCRQAGCGLLLDVNNLMVNALNDADAAAQATDDTAAAAGPAEVVAGAAGHIAAATAGAALAGPAPAAMADAALQAGCAFVNALPPGIVGEIHLAGYCETGGLVIDDHGSRVRPAVWALYEHALRRFGAVPTLVEWDTDVPPLEVLLGEAALAAARVRATASELRP